MIKEEWRMHSTLYRGRSFAAFPFLVFLFSLTFTFATVRYSTLDISVLGSALKGIAAFLGLAVGSIGFSSRDAMKNVLGPTNFLAYSSRTLPVSETRLLFDFIVKDILYYIALFLLPVSLGVLIPTGTGLLPAALMVPFWFFGALAVSVLVARSSLKLSQGHLLSYRKLEFLSPLTSKSVLDVSRSSGGMIKVLFSTAILTGFYWFAVLHFPAASYFLQNPLLSFSAVIGLLNLSVYNWLNRFDSPEDYMYLPLGNLDLLDAKKQAYLVIAVPLAVTLVLLSYLVYPSMLLLSLLTAVSTTLYTLAIASWLTGLNPNRKLFSSKVFLKYLAANSVVVVPLLVMSVMYTRGLFLAYISVIAFAVTVYVISLH